MALDWSVLHCSPFRSEVGLTTLFVFMEVNSTQATHSLVVLYFMRDHLKLVLKQFVD